MTRSNVKLYSRSEVVPLMAAKREAVFDAFGLVVFERWQVGLGGRFGFVENGLGELLQRGPARPVEGRGVGNAAEGRAPFDDDAVDVAGAEKFRDPACLAQRIFANALHAFGGAPA